MGYDITLVSLYDIAEWLRDNGKTIEDIEYFEVRDMDEQESTYLSYNFSKFSEIWYARNSFGKTSEEFANDLREASKKLTEQKVVAEIPSGFRETITQSGEKKQVPYDGWTPDSRVFHWHIKRLLKICEDNPGCVVLADIDHGIHITEEELKNCDKIKVKEQPHFVTYYRHPLKGNVKVDTFEKACEIAMIAKKNQDERWIMWEELAWCLPGAPRIKN